MEHHAPRQVLSGVDIDSTFSFYYSLLSRLALILVVCWLGKGDGGHSSVGRASDCGSECRGFDPHWPPHQPSLFLLCKKSLRLASRRPQP